MNYLMELVSDGHTIGNIILGCTLAVSGVIIIRRQSKQSIKSQDGNDALIKQEEV